MRNTTWQQKLLALIALPAFLIALVLSITVANWYITAISALAIAAIGYRLLAVTHSWSSRTRS